MATPQGRVLVRWAAGESLELRRLRRRQVLRIGLRPVAAGGPELSGEPRPRQLERLLRKGLLLGQVGLSEDPGRVVDVAQRLAGRPLLRR